MSLPAVLTALAEALRQALGDAAAQVGGARPVSADELPAVTLSASAARFPQSGVGRLSEQHTGALVVETAVDLENPSLEGDGEEGALLSEDRLTLHLPHGPLVRADGQDLPPFAAGDLKVRLGATTFAVVAAEPAAGEVRPDARSNSLGFGAPLPATGDLELRFHVGRWQVRAFEVRALLEIEAAAADAAGVETLCAALAEALEPARLGRFDPSLEVHRLALSSWGPILPPAEGGAEERRRRLVYDLAAGWQRPVLETAGDVIRRVEALVRTPRAAAEPIPDEHDEERFHVVHDVV
jgi:hypothetical protein